LYSVLLDWIVFLSSKALLFKGKVKGFSTNSKTYKGANTMHSSYL